MNYENPQLIKLNNKQDFDCYCQSDFARQTQQFEIDMCNDNIDNESWYSYGYCEVCDSPSKFLIDWQYSNKETNYANLRERLICNKCGLNNRQRFVVSYIKNIIDKPSSIYMYEQVTELFNWFKHYFNDSDIMGSEYLGDDVKSGSIINNIRHEDALNLSFDDGIFDVIVSNDVFEHVPDISKTLSEAYRVLKNDGKLIFTIPFNNNCKETIKRAEVTQTGIVNLLPPVYHGNPVSENGSLVVYDFGWDIIDICKIAGFTDCGVYICKNYLHGYLGTNFVFIAQK